MATFWIFLSTAVRKGKFRRQEWNSFSTCLLFLETSVIRLPSRVDFTVSKSPGSENERGPEFQVAMRASFLATTVTTTSRSYGKHYTRRCSLIQEACVSHPRYTLWWKIEFDNDIRKCSYHITTPYTADLLLDASKASRWMARESGFGQQQFRDLVWCRSKESGLVETAGYFMSGDMIIHASQNTLLRKLPLRAKQMSISDSN